MTSDQLLANIIEAARVFIETVRSFIQACRDTFRRLLVDTNDLCQHLLDYLTEPSSPRKTPPSYPPASWAYYGGRVNQRFKRKYRQERIWRHQG